ncbi:hypothetical protein [Aquamicrobium soli]|uniref:DUF2922 domain-containing protein n=1 Tax=Aquamicrobium soli TaxID=1811518 RepID=A0ABV7K6W7_9HYPH
MMKIVIEFYRTRDADDAHAVVGRETVEVKDIEVAIAAARLLAQTLDMPQCPDSMTITDANGQLHYSGIIGREADEGR